MDNRLVELDMQEATTRDAMREAAVALADEYCADWLNGDFFEMRISYANARTAHRAALKALEDEKNGN